jgi:hypothetical protein
MSLDGIPLTADKRVWTSCCVTHDTRYWLGGTETDKAAADKDLERCIADKGYPEIGHIYRAFVDRLGGPESLSTYRWGYGWNFRRPYGEITGDEEKQAIALYGVDKELLPDLLVHSTSVLERTCDTYDYSLKGYSADEKLVYRYLSAHLKEDDVIEWARSDYFNLSERRLAVKLASCEPPVLISISQKSNRIVRIQSECSALSSL